MTNCAFWNNIAGYAGGGMYNYDSSSPTLVNCIFRNNLADDDGGGMYNKNFSSPTLTNCAFWNNIAGYAGGGMYNEYYCNPTLTNCIVNDNSAGHGGGMRNYNLCSPTLANCTFSNNSALSSSNALGGGMYNFKSNPYLIKCNFSGNSSLRKGGGMFNCGYSSATFTNCIFYGNSSDYQGGGIYITFSSPILTNCTFSDNSADYRGGGIFIERNCYLRLTNCIMWQDTPQEVYDHFINLNTLDITYSDVQGGWPAGEGNIDTDPCFADPCNGDYHLLSDSPCIDAGDNNSIPADAVDLDGDGNTTEPIPWDLDGNARIVDGNSDGNAVVDMGAYEAPVPPVEVAMKFTPQALNPGSKGRWVKAHLVLPEEYAVEDVDANTPAVVQPGGIESDYINVFINEEGLVEVEAAFDRGEFSDIVTGGQPLEVRVTGSFTSGQQFYGIDTIKITHNYLEYLEVLASHWLEADCGKPDWCEGADIDQDSMVNFRDFVFFDGCCIEIVGE